MCDVDVISQEDIKTYESLVQEATQENCDLVDSKRWEHATIKEKSQDQPLLPKAYTIINEQSINKSLKQVDFKIHRSGNGSGSGRGSSSRSDITCQKCGKREISRKTEGQREMAIVVTHPRSSQISFQNGLLRSLLSQIPNI